MVQAVQARIVVRAAALVLAGLLVGLYLRPSATPVVAVTANRAAEVRIPTPAPTVVREYRYIIQAASGPGAPTVSSAVGDFAQADALGEGEVAVHLESAFQANGARSTESRVLEETIRSAFEEPAISGAHVKTLECRRDRCRVEVDFDDTEADKRVMRQIFMESDAIEMAMTAPLRVKRPDGKVSATIHLYPQNQSPF